MDERCRFPRIFSPPENSAQGQTLRDAIRFEVPFGPTKERARSRPRGISFALGDSRRVSLRSSCDDRGKIGDKFGCDAQRSSCDRMARNSVIRYLTSALPETFAFFSARLTPSLNLFSPFPFFPNSPRLVSRFFCSDFSRSNQSRRSRNTSVRDRLL